MIWLVLNLPSWYLLSICPIGVYYLSFLLPAFFGLVIYFFFFYKAVHFKFSIGFLNIALCIFLHQSRQYKYPKFIKSTVK